MIYGRFDLSYGRQVRRPGFALEYNADTPTALLEAAVIQWYWLQDIRPDADQFNSIHERLVAKWKELATYIFTRPLYFVHADSAEDMMTVSYLRDTAEQAGIQTTALLMQEIGWNARPGRASWIWKTIPCARFSSCIRGSGCWKTRPFGVNALATYGAGPAGRGPATPVQWMEPIWKMVLSNKGILAILWEMFPGAPESARDVRKISRAASHGICQKAQMSRGGGANVTLQSARESASTGGAYGQEGFVYQAVAALPDFDGNRPVIGSWVIDGESAGMGIRESSGPITDNLSRFVPPHMFLP